MEVRPSVSFVWWQRMAAEWEASEGSPWQPCPEAGRFGAQQQAALMHAQFSIAAARADASGLSEETTATRRPARRRRPTWEV